MHASMHACRVSYRTRDAIPAPGWPSVDSRRQCVRQTYSKEHLHRRTCFVTNANTSSQDPLQGALWIAQAISAPQCLVPKFSFAPAFQAAGTVFGSQGSGSTQARGGNWVRCFLQPG